MQTIFKQLDLEELKAKQAKLKKQKEDFIVDAPGNDLVHMTETGLSRRHIFGDFVRTPWFDYVTLGLCYNNDIHALVKEFVYSGYNMTPRFRFKKGQIFIDNRPIGNLVFSTGKSTRYGRKLLLKFSGEFFRQGFPLELIYGFRNAFEDAVYERFDEIEEQQWINKTTIDRLDLAMELRKRVFPGRTTSIQPYEVLELFLGMPGGMNWREGNFSEDGQTAYASESKKANKNRGTKPLLRFYSKVKDDTFRIEIEFPKVVTFEENNIESFTKKATEIFSFFMEKTSFHIGEIDDPEKDLISGSYRVPRFDPTLSARPEEFACIPYAGHVPHELERLTKQSTTMLSHCIITRLTCRELRKLKRENVDELLRKNLTDEEKKLLQEAEPPDECPWPLAEGLNWDEIKYDLPLRHHSCEDFDVAKPIPLEELYELHNLLQMYQDYMYPGSPNYQAGLNNTLYLEMMSDPHAWAKKLLLPKPVVSHKNDRWILHQADVSGAYYLEGPDGETLHVSTERAKAHEATVRAQAYAFYDSFDELVEIEEEQLAGSHEEGLAEEAYRSKALLDSYRVRQSPKFARRYRLKSEEERDKEEEKRILQAKIGRKT